MLIKKVEEENDLLNPELLPLSNTNTFKNQPIKLRPLVKFFY